MANLRRFASGATRDSDAEETRFDLITPIAMKRLAMIYAKGAEKHGDRTWEKGIPASVNLNHAERHLNLWLSGDISEDHLAKVCWSLFAIMHFEKSNPKMMDIPARKVS